MEVLGYAGRRLMTEVRVPGHISNPKFFPFWRDDLKASPFILSAISESYRLPFKSNPPSGMCKNKHA